MHFVKREAKLPEVTDFLRWCQVPSQSWDLLFLRFLNRWSTRTNILFKNGHGHIISFVYECLLKFPLWADVFVEMNTTKTEQSALRNTRVTSR
jgi:hypothetical protein